MQIVVSVIVFVSSMLIIRLFPSFVDGLAASVGNFLSLIQTTVCRWRIEFFFINNKQIEIVYDTKNKFFVGM